MSRFYPEGAFYSPYGYAPRNDPQNVPAKNPCPENAMSNDTGNAGADGYTVLSRASRFTGERPSIQGTPQYDGPRNEDN